MIFCVVKVLSGYQSLLCWRMIKMIKNAMSLWESGRNWGKRGEVSPDAATLDILSSDHSHWVQLNITSKNRDHQSVALGRCGEDQVDGTRVVLLSTISWRVGNKAQERHHSHAGKAGEVKCGVQWARAPLDWKISDFKLLKSWSKMCSENKLGKLRKLIFKNTIRKWCGYSTD